MSSFTVPEGPPLRADSFLARQVPGWSRRTAQRAIAAGAVRRRSHAPGAAHRVRKGDFANGGEVFDIDEAWLAPQELQPNAELQLVVVYEDADIVVVDKPAGVASVALRADETGTVANFLLSRWPALAAVGRSSLEAGLLHRLDTNTSGLLLAAKTMPAYRELRRQFASQSMVKEYLAVVHGDVPAAGWVTTPIAHDRRRRARMRVVGDAGGGRVASTRFEPATRRGHHEQPRSDQGARGRASLYSLLKVRISTGVMHQIRVHLASIGHPVVGDRLYGSTLALAADRHLLHASRLAFTHPRSGEPIEVQSPPPGDFDEFTGA